LIHGSYLFAFDAKECGEDGAFIGRQQ
jgi:hypothetical protein